MSSDRAWYQKSVLIHEVGVAGDVPAVAHIVPLPLVREVAASGRAAHGEAADAAGSNGTALRIDDLRLIARTGLPVAPGRISSSVAAMKMCSISVAPIPSMSLIPVPFQASKVALGSGSPAETHLRRDDVVAFELAQHGAVGGGRREADGGLVLRDGGQQLVRSRFLEQHGGRADVHGEQHDPAEPEGEGAAASR